MQSKELVAFGRAVYHYRKVVLDISQEALAERADLHRTYVSSLERGERNVGLLNIFKLAKALNISVTKLFETVESRRR